MENYLQKLAVLFVSFCVPAVLIAAPPKPFSHKYHLTQVPACESCHVAATDSSKADDNLIPTADTCARCHDDVNILPPRSIGVQKFNHALHVKLGSPAPLIAGAVKSKKYLGTSPPAAEQLTAKDACAGCHYGIAESENVPHDKVAKAHFPQMADCLVCHNSINPPDSCNKCHVPSTPNFRPVSHTPEFSDKHSSKEVPKAECAVCHSRSFTCKGCH